MLNSCALTVNTSAEEERKKTETMEVVKMNKEQIFNEKPQTLTQTLGYSLCDVGCQ